MTVNNDDIIILKNGSSSAKIHLHGATVISWIVGDKELLFLSSKALLDGSKPIRGGIPLVFPQFGTGNIMSGQHGFARTLKWASLESEIDSKAIFQLNHSDYTLSLWPHKFSLIYTVELDNIGNLITSMKVENLNDTSFEFTALFHTYFNVKDIRSVTIKGLSGLEYADKTKNMARFKEERSEIKDISEEVDRNYFHVPGHVLLSSLNSQIQLTSDFKDLVVWNPWIEKAKSMADFDDEEYKEMVCLEFGHVESPLVLSAHEIWCCKQELKCVL